MRPVCQQFQLVGFPSLNLIGVSSPRIDFVVDIKPIEQRWFAGLGPSLEQLRSDVKLVFSRCLSKGWTMQGVSGRNP